jgi:hypothetical protein
MCISGTSMAQLIQLHPGGDTTSTISLAGYVDVYYAFDFSQPRDFTRPYSVSQGRNNEFNLNLAYLSLKYNSSRVRATFTPGFGTYMNANYAEQRLTLQNILEANAGVKPFKNYDIWIDAGVMVAPYTTETAISFDQLLYTRSFASEYSPYYIKGARLTVPIGKKIIVYLYIINGWQVIEDVNAPESFASTVDYKPNDKVTIDWNTYAGNEQSGLTPTYESRYVCDIAVTYTPSEELTLAADAYAGLQHERDSLGQKSFPAFGQGNINAKYNIDKVNSISARAEYYKDMHDIFIEPITGIKGFNCYSYSLCYNMLITKNVLFRAEARYYQSTENVFYSNNMNPIKTDMLVIGGLTAKF